MHTLTFEGFYLLYINYIGDHSIDKTLKSKK